MFRTWLLLCSVPVVISIIVTDPPPAPTDYKYSYDIEDPTTGDSKSQHEVRRGDIVTGAYSVVDPNGTKRIVEYTADAKHGFQAVVREEPAEVQETSPTPAVRHDNFLHYHHDPGLIANHVFSADTIKPQISYAKANYVAEPAIYFTPLNEIKSENVPFTNGKYFAPV